MSLKINYIKRTIIAAAIILAVVFLAVLPAVTIYIYEDYFGFKSTPVSWRTLYTDDFAGLKSKKYTFTGDHSQKLAAYSYYKEGVNKSGVVIIAHGMGCGGHNFYMNVADYFAGRGYYVFAYDGTGCGESDGDSMRGLPQAVADLDYAVSFVKQNEDFNGLPIAVFGHSLGGYAAAAVLNIHPDIKAAAVIAGFDNHLDMIKEHGQAAAGGFLMGLASPYISVYERFKFGKYASYAGVQGFEKSECQAVIVHSEDDSTVSMSNGYDRFYQKFKDDPRFSFIKYNNRGHSYLYFSDAARSYMNEIEEAYSEYAAQNGGHSAGLKESYMRQNLDKQRYFELDDILMSSIADVFDRAVRG